jgi:hypothetical protein
MPAAPRIVFFGLPLTGKTGLLHAFADPEAPFPLSKYGDGPKPDLCRTLPDGTVLCDVDSPVAKELIDDPARIERGDRTAQAVRDANAIVLVLDASATDDATLGLFQSFAAFLDGFETARCRNREVGGLPVFLTLTKCDRLARPGDGPDDWFHRVQARKESVRTAFEDYLASRGTSNAFAFGSLEVHVAATALQFPKDPRFDALEAPFGVGELRDECLAAATAQARRTEYSQRRLRRTVAGAGAIVGAMALALAAFFALAPGRDEDRLGNRVRAYREREGPPARRLADRQLERNRKELLAIQAETGFAALPEELRAFVAGRLAECDAYREYRERFHPPRFGPAEVRTLRELDTLDAELNTILKPPAEYANDWAETEAVRLWKKWTTDAALVRTAQGALHDWHRGLVRRGTALLVSSTLDGGWRASAGRLLADADAPPYDASAEIPGSAKLPVPRGAPVRFAVPFAFDRVEQAQVDWQDAKARVLAMRDLGDALGLTGAPDPVLVFPEPTMDRAASAGLGAAMLARLPDANWSVSQFPDPLRTELQRRLQIAYHAGAKHVRGVVHARLGVESRESWAVAATWFDEPDAKAWGRLLQKIGTWGEFAPGDPATEAIAFLRKDAFESDLSTLELTVPNDLRERRPIPRGPLVIRVRLPNATSRELSFRVVGEPTVSATATVHRFAPDGHDGKPWFAPGEPLKANLTMRSGDAEFELEWDGGTAVYGFDALGREPTVKTTTGPRERATGVKLTAPSLPRLPTLLRPN